MREETIVHESGDFFVLRTSKNWFGYPENTYSVYQNKNTHSVPVASFERNEDGLSLSKAYCDYKSKAKENK